jgi:DNA-binding NtrC family response regulator
MTTILLVDDDPFQASIITSLLGYRFGEVCRAKDAAEALCLIEERDFAENIGLVISGHHTQGIGGPAFVSELHSRMPYLPILVLGALGENLANYDAEQAVFLEKPFAAQRMLTLVGQMLAQHKTAVA